MAFVGAGGTAGSPGTLLQATATIAGGATWTSHGIGTNGMSRVRLVATFTDGDPANLICTLQWSLLASTDASAWHSYAPAQSIPLSGEPVVVEGVLTANAVRVVIENATAATSSTIEVYVMCSPF